jgi:prevent-host-death family protein
MKVSVYEAKSKLSQMINKALDGEDVVITRNGRDTVKLVPTNNEKSWIGSMKGQIVIHNGFFDSFSEDEAIQCLTGDRE